MASFSGPCLCGDPACPSCFPSMQERVGCRSCGWTGRRYDCGGEEMVSGYVVDVCPNCRWPIDDDERRTTEHGV